MAWARGFREERCLKAGLDVWSTFLALPMLGAWPLSDASAFGNTSKLSRVLSILGCQRGPRMMDASNRRITLFDVMALVAVTAVSIVAARYILSVMKLPPGWWGAQLCWGRPRRS